MSSDRVNPKTLSSPQLMRLSRMAIVELRNRDAVRTMNSPLGDWAELLAAIAFDGARAHISQKSWDVTTHDNRLLQVKARASAKATHYGFFRSWDFDAAVFMLFDPADLTVLEAKEVSSTTAKAAAAWVKHVNGWRLTTTQVRTLEGTDVLGLIQRAELEVDSYLADRSA